MKRVFEIEVLYCLVNLNTLTVLKMANKLDMSLDEIIKQGKGKGGGRPRRGSGSRDGPRSDSGPTRQNRQNFNRSRDRPAPYSRVGRD